MSPSPEAPTSPITDQPQPGAGGEQVGVTLSAPPPPPLPPRLDVSRDWSRKAAPVGFVVGTLASILAGVPGLTGGQELFGVLFVVFSPLFGLMLAVLCWHASDLFQIAWDWFTTGGHGTAPPPDEEPARPKPDTPRRDSSGGIVAGPLDAPAQGSADIRAPLPGAAAPEEPS
jgi:hypothetical protein